MSAKTTKLHIACDIGGTFTDLVAQAGDGVPHVRKVASTPDAPGRAVVAGLHALLADLGLTLADVGEVVHGTTVGSNIILQKKGPRTGLVTTFGFRDVLEIGRIRTPNMFDLTWDKPLPLVPRRYRLEVQERISADGSVVVPLDEGDVLAAGKRLCDEGVEAVAICFLHSHINPTHEQRTRDIFRYEFPELLVTTSCDVLPEMKEYERTSTTVVNAYLLKGMQQYLLSLTADLESAGMAAPILVVASSGGMMRIETAIEKPVFAVGSGPAGGVIGCIRLGQLNGHANLIAFDMGGTTAKASIIENGVSTMTSEYEFRDGISTSSRFIKGGGYMLKVPAIDIAEIGAGGGSIAWIDDGGLLQVGPLSAGADPGPACYGQGNKQPTVTDANVVLGYLNPTSLAGGSLPINAALSAQAIDEHIAAPLDLTRIAAAAGIRHIANIAMAQALRSVTIERGRDLRDMTLMAFGGSGPAHAIDVAAILGIGKVIIPVMSGVFSAVGMLGSDVEHNFVRSLVCRLDRRERQLLEKTIEELRSQGISRLRQDGFDDDRIKFSFTADMHYLGQSSELTVSFDPAEITTTGPSLLEDAFHPAYLEAYGYLNDEPVELVSIRLTGAGMREHRLAFEESNTGRFDAPVGNQHRDAWFDDEDQSILTPVWPRSQITRDALAGPAILESYDTTILVPPGCMATSDGYGSVMIDVSEKLIEGAK